MTSIKPCSKPPFQHTAARRRLPLVLAHYASRELFQHTAARRRLRGVGCICKGKSCFNTQPPEGGCAQAAIPDSVKTVSTHSRPKAAAHLNVFEHAIEYVSTHSRPKAAAAHLGYRYL